MTNDQKYAPNFPEGTRVKIITYDPKSGEFVERPEEIVGRKKCNAPNEKDGV